MHQKQGGLEPGNYVVTSLFLFVLIVTSQAHDIISIMTY